jgi:O-Antigen ligase
MGRPGPAARSLSWERARLRTVQAGAFLIPLTPSWITWDQFVLPRLALTRLVVAALLALWVGQAVQEGRLTLRRTALDVPLLTMTASAVLSTLLAVNTVVAVFGVYLRYEGLLTIGTYLLLFWLVTQSLTRRADVLAVVHALLASAYVLAMVAIAQSLLAGRVAGGETAQTFGGWVRADATFGNAALLGTYLAMLLPLAVQEAVCPGSSLRRALAVNAAVAMAAALALTFSRAAWLGAVAGLAMTLLPQVRRSAAARGAALLAGVVIVALAAADAAGAGPPLLASAWARAASLTTPLQGSGATRVDIWRATVGLVASRPLAGWGPDSFGLVYPTFRGGGGPWVAVDKAHSDLLQIAATQGLIGVGAFAFVAAALLRAFWRGRRAAGAFALLGAVVAYQVNVQVEFSWVPITAPFWILVAAALAAWAGPEPASARLVVVPVTGVVRHALAAAGASVSLAIAVLLAGMPLLADALSFRGAVALAHGDAPAARSWLAEARLLAPQEATYAAEAGDAAMDLQRDGQPGPRSDWSAARRAYLDATRLGAARPVVYDRLATADRALGLIAEADTAARTAKMLARTT